MSSHTPPNHASSSGPVRPCSTSSSSSSTNEPTSCGESLYLVAQSLLSQVVTVLEEVVTTDELLSRTSEYVPGSSIGKHLRHLHDHYRLLLDSIRPSSHDASSSVPLCYDVRSRNTAAETSHQAALDSFVHLQHRLEKETSQGRAIEPSRPIRLEAVTPFVVQVESSFARELWFVSLHATHHLALVRVVATELGLSVRDDFGVAPSTLVARTQKQEGIDHSSGEMRTEAQEKVEEKMKREVTKAEVGKRRESKL